MTKASMPLFMFHVFMFQQSGAPADAPAGAPVTSRRASLEFRGVQNGGIVVIIFVVGAAMIALIVLGYQQAKKRREALAGIAQRLNWQFDPGSDWSHDDRFGHFSIFARGHSRHAYNTLSGTLAVAGRACPAQAGDYQYKQTSGSGKDQRTTTYNFSYLIVQRPYPQGTPRLVIRPEGIFDKIAGALGFDDIDFESEEFSRRFCVKSPDKKFAYDVIDARTMEFFLATRPPPLELSNGQCCVSDGSRTWRPEEFEAWIRWTGDFLNRWPDFVKENLNHAAGYQAA